MRKRTRRRVAELIGFVVGSILLTCVGVAASTSDEARAPDAEAIERIELASYEKALAAWLRDSTVVDSVSRTIDTDTLYALYRKMLTAPDPAAIYQEIACEEWRLSRRHHSLPTAAAVRRMMDTVWRRDEAELVRLMNARLPKPGHVSAGHWSCGYRGEESGPAEVNGTSLAFEKPRPVRPRRRKG